MTAPDPLAARVAELEEQVASAAGLAGEIRDRFNKPVEMLGEATRLLSNLVHQVEQLLAELTT